MKIYGKTNEIMIREMEEADCGSFLELMAEHGTNADFAVQDIRVLWKFRKEKGDLQCTITSTDNKTIYGFGGIINSELCADMLNEYSNNGYEEQARRIIENIK